MYFERKYLLEPLLGKNYRYETLSIGEEEEDIVKAAHKVELDLKIFIQLEKTNNPVKSGESPF